jgi:hypothetical protein
MESDVPRPRAGHDGDIGRHIRLKAAGRLIVAVGVQPVGAETRAYRLAGSRTMAWA